MESNFDFGINYWSSRDCESSIFYGNKNVHDKWTVRCTG